MTRLEFLEDTIKYYSEDTNRRCVSYKGVCNYSPEESNKVGISDGCAIGRHCTPHGRVALDASVCGEVRNVMMSKERDYIPVFMQDYGTQFLSYVQTLHDMASYWDANGLTTFGLKEVEDIKSYIKIIENN